ncbi:Rab family GTPase [Legionella brunensis]|uniref:Rho GTPase (Miro-like) n=1 Tax=Legionella brunensis TaxID=29422 RepID=A0A0W0SD17_9GAMM|nr:GTP-binding protein [Legionella brunensis]KTC81318.1 Rho GTPase (Miro-like) [Legionella brunensis]
MRDLKIVMMGEAGSGKTQLAMRLAQRRVNGQPKQTVGVGLLTYKFKEAQTYLRIWDPSGRKNHFVNMRKDSYQNKELALYCVDLSQAVTEETLQSIKEEINIFRGVNAEAPIILVGTKADLCQEDAATKLEAIEKELEKVGITFQNTIVTSAKNTHGADDLLTLLIPELKREVNQSTERQESVFEEAKEKLLLELANLPQEKLEAITKKITHLEKALGKASQVRQIDRALSKFEQECQVILEGEHPNIINAIFTFSAAVLVTFLAGVIGFGVGYVAGLWSGPGAFISGLVAGEMAAVTTVSVCGSLGLLTGGLTAWGLFKTSKEMAAMNEFTQTIREDIAENLQI